MRITVNQLRRIIKEEVENVLETRYPDDWTEGMPTPREYTSGAGGPRLKKATKPSAAEVEYARSVALDFGLSGIAMRAFMEWFKEIEPRYATMDGMRRFADSVGGDSARSAYDSGDYVPQAPQSERY